MKVSRNRSVPVVAAMAALGISVAAVSCTGPSKTGTAPGDKTSGPALAKGDKTVEQPGVGQPAPAASTGKTPAPPTKGAEAPRVAAGDPIAPPRPGAPLPAPTEPKPLTPKAPVKPVETTASVPVVRAPEVATPAVKTPEVAVPSVKAPEVKVAAKPMSDADRILEQRIKELQLDKEKRGVLAKTFVENAKDAADQNHWDEVAQWASKAIETVFSTEPSQRLWLSLFA